MRFSSLFARRGALGQTKLGHYSRVGNVANYQVEIREFGLWAFFRSFYRKDDPNTNPVILLRNLAFLKWMTTNYSTNYCTYLVGKNRPIEITFWIWIACQHQPQIHQPLNMKIVLVVALCITASAAQQCSSFSSIDISSLGSFNSVQLGRVCPSGQQTFQAPSSVVWTFEEVDGLTGVEVSESSSGLVVPVVQGGVLQFQ